MDEFAEAGKVAYRLHQIESDIDRVGGHEADPLHARDSIEFAEEIVKQTVPFWLVFSVAVDILAEQRDLFIALIDEAAALLEDAFRRAGNFLAACIGDDAVGAELVATPDDRDGSFDFIVSLCAQIIEIFFEFVLGFEDWAAGIKGLVDHGPQVGNIVRPQDKI